MRRQNPADDIEVFQSVNASHVDCRRVCRDAESCVCVNTPLKPFLFHQVAISQRDSNFVTQEGQSSPIEQMPVQQHLPKLDESL